FKAGLALADSVSAKMDHARPGERAQGGGVDTQVVADHSQLTPSARDGRVVSTLEPPGALQSRDGFGLLAQEQASLGLGRRLVVRLRTGQQLEHGCGQLSGAGRFAGNEPERRGVDRWVVTAGLGED